MVKFKKNDKFRIKVTDRCNFSCPFCHAEGGRNANDLVIEDDFIKAVKILRPLYNRVHLTGGEPFLYDNLEQILDVLEFFGYHTAITTNGYFPFRKKQKVMEKMEYINFSIHSFQEKYNSRLVGKQKDVRSIISVTQQNVRESRNILPVRINTVVSDDKEGQRLEEIFEFCEQLNLELKLMPEWSVRKRAIPIILNMLKQNGFELYETIFLQPGSNVRNRYKNSYGQIVEVKNIEFYFPDFLCRGCIKKQNCQEGFSFLRIGGNPLYFQPCIFDKGVDLGIFEKEILPEIYSIFEKAKVK